MKFSKTKALLLAILILFCMGVFGQHKKPLRNTRYSYKMLVSRGYECKPYRGKKFLTYNRYLELITFKNITK